MKQNRFTSWTAWLTLLPIITMLGDTYGFWKAIGMPQDTFTKLFTAVGACLIAFGIFNNPTTKDSF